MTLTLTKEDAALSVGQRIIHLSHGEGKVIKINEDRQLVTVEFHGESTTHYSKIWRSLVPLGGYIEAMIVSAPSNQLNAASLQVTVPLSVIFDETSYAWSVPTIPASYEALCDQIVDRIRDDEITVDLDSLTSTSADIGEHFARTLLYLKYVSLVDSEELITATTEIVDFVMARYLRLMVAKKGAMREREFEFAITNIGSDLWATTIYSSNTSQAMRRELDRILMAIVMSTVADVDDRAHLKIIAERVLAAVEFRIADKFLGELIRRSSMPPEKVKVKKSAANAASADYKENDND